MRGVFWTLQICSAVVPVRSLPGISSRERMHICGCGRSIRARRFNATAIRMPRRVYQQLTKPLFIRSFALSGCPASIQFHRHSSRDLETVRSMHESTYRPQLLSFRNPCDLEQSNDAAQTISVGSCGVMFHLVFSIFVDSYLFRQTVCLPPSASTASEMKRSLNARALLMKAKQEQIKATRR